MSIRQAMSQLGSKVNAVAATTAAGVKVTQATDDGTIMLSFQPEAYGDTTEVIATEPVERRFNFGFASPAQFGGDGTRPDRPFFMGYNMGVDGGGSGTPQESTSDCCVGLMIEPYYNLTGTSRHVEIYFSALPAGGDPATDQVRPFFLTCQWPTLASDTAVECGAEFNLESTLGLGFNMTYDNAGTLSARAGNTSGTITITAAHNIVTATTKNVRWLGGARTGVTIGAVSATTAGSTVAFSGGSGDNLPAADFVIEFYDEDTITVVAGTTNNGLDTVMGFSAGAGLLFENNSRSIKAKLSSGTPKDLMYINSSNQLIVAEGGIVDISVGGLVLTWGITTLYETGAGAVIADTDFTGNGSSTPGNGTLAVLHDTTTGFSYIYGKANGAWKRIAIA